MNYLLKDKLVRNAKLYLIENDLAHDFTHALRVLQLSEVLQKEEGGDLEIIVPAALLHDLIVHKKSSLKSNLSATHSAELARSFLHDFDDYPRDKISKVCEIINKCSFSKGDNAPSIEGAIVQDADLIESAGAMGIMRTFYYASQIDSELFSEDDILASSRDHNAKKYALDFISSRARNLDGRVRTALGQKIYAQRKLFLDEFISQVAIESKQIESLPSTYQDYEKHELDGHKSYLINQSLKYNRRFFNEAIMQN